MKDTPYFYLEDLVKGSTAVADFISIVAKIHEIITKTKRTQSRKYIVDEPVFVDDFLNKLNSRSKNSHIIIQNSLAHLLSHLKNNSNGILNASKLNFY